MKRFGLEVAWVGDRLRILMVRDGERMMSRLSVSHDDGRFLLEPRSGGSVVGSCGGNVEEEYAEDLWSAVVMLASYFASWNSDLVPLDGKPAFPR